jgi:hypothetical protein
MRKVKLDSKSEKSAERFFDDENPDKNETLCFTGSTDVLGLGKERSFTNEQKYFTKLLKQVFIFLPRTFLLFYMSFGVVIIFMEIAVYGRPVETLPDDFPFQFAFMGLIILLGTLMTWFGLGDLKNRKHFAIPTSLIALGVILGAIVKIAEKVSDSADKMLDDFSYLIYLLPLALITPFLAKGIVEWKSEDAS